MPLIENLLEEVLDTPCPEPAPYSALRTLVTVGHGNIPGANIPLHTTLHHLLLLVQGPAHSPGWDQGLSVENIPVIPGQGRLAEVDGAHGDAEQDSCRLWKMVSRWRTLWSWIGTNPKTYKMFF